MTSTAYPYPVNDNKSTVRRAARQPHIYSPSELHHSPRNAMYPHLHTSSSPSPNYIYPGYEQYYSKDSWANIAPSSWSTFYPLPPRSSSLPENAVNPKVTVFPPQPILVSDIDTPSSISSHTVLTPSSPFVRHDMDEEKFESMEFDEFDCDDEEDFVDSDFADEMEGIDETDTEDSHIYGASAPHVIKSTSALEGALGDTPSSPYHTDLGLFTPADRRLSASVPGYPSASHQRLTSTSPVPDASYPSQRTYTQRNHASSTSMSAQTSPSALYHHMSSSSSLAGAFTSSVPSPHASRPTPTHLPILQPQPIRPIPPIPLADLTSSAEERSSPVPCARAPHRPSRTLSPLPLLCQPVSDAIRYRLGEPPSSGAHDDACYADDNTSESMCDDLVTSETHRFAQHGLTFCHAHPLTGGTCSVREKLYSCGRADLPIRWQ